MISRWIRAIFVIAGLLWVAAESLATGRKEPDNASVDENCIKVMFYNVENLFDTFDDPAVNDDEFTPQSEKKWSYYRYSEKLNHIAKVIIAAGGWQPPDIVGLCEIENYGVLIDLTTKTPLKKYEYRIIHQDSPDARGIDVALLYRPEKLMEIRHIFMPVRSRGSHSTRDILYAVLSSQHRDTLHLFVNHWPSRVGGKAFSEGARINAAEVLKSAVDSLFSSNIKSKVVIMGDFNDEPADISIAAHLGAERVQDDISYGKLYNLSYDDFKKGKGTLVHKTIDNTWYLFDQFIVSGALINDSSLHVKGTKSNIFKPPWLLKDDKPFRTYRGPIYSAGFSDHLPIFIDLCVDE